MGRVGDLRCSYAPTCTPLSLVNCQSIWIRESGSVYRSTWNSPSVDVCQCHVHGLLPARCDGEDLVGSLTLNIIPHPAVLTLVVVNHLYHLQEVVLL